MKIDVILINPPFANGLHLKFFSLCSKICDKMVTIQPCNWLFLKSKQRRTCEVRELVDHYGADIEVYREGSNPFGSEVNFKSNIAITMIDFNDKKDITITGLEKNKSIYKSIDDVKLFGHDKIWNSIYDKIINNKDVKLHYHANVYKQYPRIINYFNNSEKLESHANVYKHLPGIIAYFQKVGHTVDKDDVKEFEGKWVVNHGTMSGHISKNGGHSDDFTALIGRGARWMHAQKFDDVKDDLKIFYAFDTQEEAQNMIDYLNTDFVRSILYMTKIGQANIVCDQYCPWQDFKQKWTDERLFKKYNITKEEQDRIREVLPDYYGIRDKK